MLLIFNVNHHHNEIKEHLRSDNYSDHIILDNEDKMNLPNTSMTKEESGYTTEGAVTKIGNIIKELNLVNNFDDPIELIRCSAFYYTIPPVGILGEPYNE